MLFLIVGLAVAFNIVIVIWKIRNDRIADGILDGFLLILVSIVFSGSQGALIIGTIGSLIVSLYLLRDPVRLADA